MPCNNNCVNMSCHMNGTCTRGCIVNFYGSACETPCSEHCARVANDYACSSETGICLFGCVEGFTGGTCMQALQQDNGGRTVLLAAIGAGVSALVIVVFAVAIGVFVCIRRRGPKPKSKSVIEATKDDADLCAPVYSTVAHKALETTESLYENTSSVKVNIAMGQIQNAVYTNSSVEKNASREEMTSPIEDTLEIDEWDSIARQNAIRFEENGGVYYNNDDKVENLKIPVAKLQEFVMSKNMEYFKTEFEKLPYGLIKDYMVSQMKANIGKNRYKDIYPYDDHRVKVVGWDTDYINASFIDGYKRRKQYIATLGPMSKQLGNFGLFWSMAWQHKVEKIVMLTNLVEEGNNKCEQYWPSVDATKMYGDILVLCQSEDDNAEFTRRTFTVVKDKVTRTMTQLHFTSWPDKDVPENITSIIEFRQNVIQASATLGGPIIVHCSAGVGRTGTYIAIDILTKEGEAEGAVDIPGCVLNMRQNRPNMVQTVGQYEYLHHAVVHSLIFNCKPVADSNFQSYMDTTSQDQIMKMFHQLQETTSRVSPDEAIAIERNAQYIDKNREASDIPGDEHRPRLFLNQKPGSTDYVNAVFVNSFQTKDKYLLAQSPLPNTVSDFLALIVQADCSCVVSFEPTSIPAKGIGVYLPVENQILNKGIFSVRCSKPEANSYRIKRTLSISQHGNEAGDVVFSITHLEFTDWDPEHCVPRSTLHFRRLIDEVDDATANMDAHRPILIHCLDGASKCGLFCVVANLLQKMKADHEVSVENDVRKIKTRRKGAIPNLEQFQFCHSCVLDYIQSFDIYYNTSADGSDV
ncbi:receptor-type tyrosine-protein phosphatase T-like [Dreissena polymorpha]|uniref:receptor-type tyrosine-protein phosphatase T-like n=1 Tax=Dreissena polymorpha TaxID=45954 RepID=UPI002263DC9D|nr:receptor-type tyrosine-protein phosphatase T-like [Dreissena polymorpha]